MLAKMIKEQKNNEEIYKLVNKDETIFFACATLRPETMCG